jgi:hypothetical protein
MTKMDSDTSEEFVKLMLIGDSGSGKTGALASLARAGYKIRIADMDGGTRPLAEILKATDRAALANVEYQTFRDKFKTTKAGTQLIYPATAYLDATKTMNEWDDGSKPFEWGKDYIYVVDSFTLLCQAARNQAESLAPASKDPRQWFYAAQKSAEHFLAAVCGPHFRTNVIISTHITDIEMNDGTRKGFPSAIGVALSRHIGKYLNEMFIVETKGSGGNVKRIIRSCPNGQTDAKTSLVGLAKELPIETGLADIFAAFNA